MKYSVGQKLEYQGRHDFKIQIITIKETSNYPYICKVLNGPWSVGNIWNKKEKDLDKKYKVVTNFSKHKEKLNI